MKRRFEVERAALERTVDRSPHTRVCRASADGRLYDLEFNVRTLVRDDAGHVGSEQRRVRVLYELHPEHPQYPPVVFARDVDLFNVHLHDPRQPSRLPDLPLICLGPFTPSMRLADWVTATWDVLRWSRIATDSPLNEAAAEYARSADPARFPVDRRPFDSESETPPHAPGEADDGSGDASGEGLRILTPWVSGREQEGEAP